MATGMSKANARQGSHRKVMYANYRANNTQEGNKLKRIMRHVSNILLYKPVLELTNGKFKIGFVTMVNGRFIDCSDEFKLEVTAVNRIADRIGVAKTKSFVA